MQNAEVPAWLRGWIEEKEKIVECFLCEESFKQKDLQELPHYLTGGPGQFPVGSKFCVTCSAYIDDHDPDSYAYDRYDGMIVVVPCFVCEDILPHTWKVHELFCTNCGTKVDWQNSNRMTSICWQTTSLMGASTMTLHSVFTGEGFQASPGQFFQMMQRWIYENRSSDLMTYFEKLQGQSASDQAEMLIEWIDNNATEGQIESCIQFIMDEIGHSDRDNQDICEDDDYYDSID